MTLFDKGHHDQTILLVRGRLCFHPESKHFFSSGNKKSMFFSFFFLHGISVFFHTFSNLFLKTAGSDYYNFLLFLPGHFFVSSIKFVDENIVQVKK